MPKNDLINLVLIHFIFHYLGEGIMVFNATFYNISVISWWSVVLVEKTGVSGDNMTCRKSLTNFITLSSTPCHECLHLKSSPFYI